MPCGSGVCGVCAVATGRGHRLACREGPAFPLEALRFAPEPEPGEGSEEEDGAPADGADAR